ncbi:MAG: molecular chaperone DnaK [Clostridiales bacterium]|nr:molecular chaperone DnaK [Clostridiales bacterium]
MAKIIGIDLGTTNSCVAVMEGGEPVIIPNAEGGRTTPSVVAFSKTGERMVGSLAKRQAVTNHERTVSSIKRQMGTNYKVNIDGHKYTPQEISAMILQKLKADAEAFLGEPVSDAVITVPAYFTDAQRQATKDAGKIAGLNVQRIINEPTAAALAYGIDKEAEQKIMVYDLGGGTFDVSILDISSGVIEVLATAGNNHLGGDDFDQCIVDYLVQEFKKENKIDLSRDSAAMQRIREAAEKAKIELSAMTQTSIELPYITVGKNGPLHMDIPLSRAKFNDLTYHLVQATREPVNQAINDSGVSIAQISKVLMVGGSSRIPAVQEKVRQLTGIMPSKSINPDECVAQGAAIQGDTLNEHTTLTNSTGLLLLDVTPLSLAIETVGGVATRVVERNSTLPVHYQQVFTTAGMFQSSVEINVLQGERPMARDNKSIGKFRLKGIRRAMAGVPKIEVTFDIDTNGILTVSARDQDTGRAQSITITADNKMSEDEIQQAIRDAEQYAAQDAFRRDLMDTINQAQHLLAQVSAALNQCSKQLDKDEKKRVKDDEAALRHLIGRAKPDKMTADDLSAIKSAMATLESSSAHLMSLFDPNAQGSEQS